MTDNDPQNWTPRRQTLTDADMEMIRGLMSDHGNCKFPRVSHEEMDDIKRLAGIFRAAEKAVVKGIAIGLLTIIAGFFYLLYAHGFFFRSK